MAALNSMDQASGAPTSTRAAPPQADAGLGSFGDADPGQETSRLRALLLRQRRAAGTPSPTEGAPQALLSLFR